MLRNMTIVGAMIASPVAAADWAPLDGAGVQAALEEVTLVYDADNGGATQHFYASGRTLYDSGRPSWGYWAVRGDQYCSQWPPSDGWSCYDLERNATGDMLRFVAGDGSSSIGEVSE